MNWELYFRYVMEMIMIIPASVFVFIPVVRNMRYSPVRVAVVALLAEAPFVFLSAWICLRLNIRSAVPMIAAVLLFFPLYRYEVLLSWRKLTFCFSFASSAAATCPFSSPRSRLRPS